MTNTFSRRALSFAAILLVALSASLLSGCAKPSWSGSSVNGHLDRDGGGGD